MGEGGELAGEVAVVAFDVELEIEPQAAGVPIGRADERPDAIDDHQLGVVEGRRREPDAAAALRAPARAGPCRPIARA